MDKKSVGMRLRWSFTLYRWGFVRRAEVSRPWTCALIDKRLLACGLLANHAKALHTHNPEACISSRVPTVQAFGLTCALPMKVKLQSTRAAVQPRLVCTTRRQLHREGSAFAHSWLRVGIVFCAPLKRLAISSYMPVFTASWPTSVRQRSFGDTFNQPIAEVVWPASLQQLSFGDCFNQPIAEVVWPVFLQQLSFGGRLNQAIAKVVWPASLEQLSFGVFFDQPIADVMWPTTLQRLLFGDAFIHPIAGVVWPVSLAPIVWRLLQPAHHKRRVAGLPAPAIIW
ncbi:unnamed protein product [Ectocarpus sp. 4 AP-2014]